MFSIILTLSVFLCLRIARVGVGARLWLLSPVGLYCGYYLVRTLPGVIASSFDLDSIKPLLGHIISFIGIAGGILASSRFIPRQPGVRSDEMDCGSPSLMKVFVVVGVLSVLFTFAMLGRVPLLYGFEAISGGADMGMQAARRMNTLQHHDGNTFYFGQGYLRILYTYVAPFFVGVLAVRAAIYEGSMARRYYLLMLLFIIFGALNGQIWIALKILILFFLFILFLRYLQGHEGNRGVIRKVFLAYFSALAFVFGFRYLQMISGRTMDGFFLSTFDRIFSYDQGKLFVLFPDSQPFRWGSTWLNDIGGLMPGSVQSFAYEVHYLVHGGGWGFTLNPGIIASAYVNFGYLGIFFSSFCLTFIYLVAFSWFLKSRKLVKVCLALLCSYGYAMSFDADIASFVVEILSATIIYILYYSIEGVVLRRKWVAQ